MLLTDKWTTKEIGDKRMQDLACPPSVADAEDHKMDRSACKITCNDTACTNALDACRKLTRRATRQPSR